MAEKEGQKKNWTRQDLLRWAEADFARRGIDTPRLDAELLLAHALGCRRVDLYLAFEQCPSEEERARFRELVQLRRRRMPVAHILGRVYFHELEFLVPPGIFVPRPETELLVDEAAVRLRQLSSSGLTILDLCTGAGPIALALAHAFPHLSAAGVDLDPKAGEVFQKNTRALGLGNRVQFFGGDLFEPVSTLGPFDLIASNPPYVPSGQIPSLMPEVREHESRFALDGGPDGLDIIRRILGGAPPFLKACGWLLLEIGEGQAEAVRDLAPPDLFIEAVRRDLAGCPRIMIFRKKE